MNRAHLIAAGFSAAVGIVVGIRAIVRGELDATSVLAFSLSLLPYFVLRYAEIRELRAVERALPEFLRDIASSRRAGLTLPLSIKASTALDYGKLSKDVEKIYTQITWGIPLEEALLRFSNRRPSKHIQRSISIIVEANRSGGEITSTLDAVANFSKMTREMEEELKGSMKIYTIIIYFSHLIFLGIVVMLINSLLAGMSTLPGMLVGGSLEDMKKVLFHMALIQGGFTGLVAGKVGEGSIYDGVKHSIALVVVSFLVFKLLVGV